MKTYGTFISHRRSYLWMACLCCLQILTLSLSAYTNITINVTLSGIPGGCTSGNFPKLMRDATQLASMDFRSATYYSFPNNIFSGSECIKVTLDAGGCLASTAASTVCYAITANNQTLAITLNCPGGLNQGPPPSTTNHYVRTCVKNESSFPMTFSLASAASGGTEYTTFTVPAMSSACGTAGPFSSKREIYLHQLSGPPLVDGEVSFTVPANDDGFTDWTESINGATPSFGSPAGTPGGSPTTVPTNAPNNIDFTGNTGDAKDSTLREGFSALREGLINGFSVTHQGLQDIVVATEANGAQLVTANGKLTTIDTSLNTIKSDTTSIKSSATSIATSVASADTKLSTISTEITSVKTAAQQTKTAVESVSNLTSQVKTSTDNVKSSVDTLGGKLDTANTKLGEIKTGGDARNSLLTTIEYNTANAAGKLEEIKLNSRYLQDMNTALIYTKIATEGTKSAVDTANTKLTGLQTSLDGVNTKLTGIGSGVDGINTKLSTLNTTADEMNDALGSIATNISGNGQSLDGIKQSTFATATQLTNANATLRALTNMFSSKKLTASEINDYKDNGQTLGEAAFSGLQSMSESIGTPDPTSASMGSSFVLNIGGRTFDCNPLNYPAFASMAAKTRLVLTWFCTCFFLFIVWNKFQEYIMAASQVTQTHANGADIFGVSVGQLTGPVFAGIICAAIAAIPVAAASIMSSFDILGWSSTNPFNNFTGGAIGDGLALANAFIPLDIVLISIVTYFVVTLSMSVIYGVATFVIKWMFA